MAALLQHTRLMASQVGRSSRLWRTSSSSSRLVSWPSPFSVLRLILSGDRFLANLWDAEEKCSFETGDIYRSRFLARQLANQTNPNCLAWCSGWKQKEGCYASAKYFSFSNCQKHVLTRRVSSARCVWGLVIGVQEVQDVQQVCMREVECMQSF